MIQIRLFVPKVGTRLRLTKPWSFGLHYERRNESLLKVAGVTYTWQQWLANLREARAKGGSPADAAPAVEGVTLPAGTTLIVNRVYVRSGQSSEFDSITFRVEKGCPDPKYDKCRFWVRLADANKIQFEVDKNWLE